MQDPEELDKINALLEESDATPEEEVYDESYDSVPDEPEWEDELEGIEEDPEIPFGMLPSIEEIRKAYGELFCGLDEAAQTEASLKGVDLEIDLAKAEYKRKCIAAVSNWDRDKKQPIDNTLPYNSGSNDEKRISVNEELFADDLRHIADLQRKKVLLEQNLVLDQCDVRVARHYTEMLSLVVRFLGVVATFESILPDPNVELEDEAE